MGATSWTESTGVSTLFLAGAPSGAVVNGFSLFGMPIPIANGAAWQDAGASWSEQSVTATTFAEKTVPSTTWTEASG